MGEQSAALARGAGYVNRRFRGGSRRQHDMGSLLEFYLFKE
jgi:hypothetical protein